MSASQTFRLLVAVLLSLLFTACARAQGLTVERVAAEGRLYTVAVVDLQRDTLRLHWKNPATGEPYRTFRQVRERLEEEGQRMLFATNSGIYAPGLRPLGLHVENGQALVGLNNARSGGNFALLPNGVFWVRGGRAGVPVPTAG